MSIFYENYVKICAMSGVKPTRAAMDCKIGKSTVTSWKTEKSNPTDSTLEKLCIYFGCLPMHLKEADGIEKFKDYIYGNTDIYGKKIKPSNSTGELADDENEISEVTSPATQKIIDAVSGMTEDEKLKVLDLINIAMKL